jgi:hypothetical protein
MSCDLSKQLIVLRGFCLFVALMCASMLVVARDPVQSPEVLDKMTSLEFFQMHGLDSISRHFADIITLFDASTHFFTKLDDDGQFRVLNLVISAFRDSYIKSVGDVSSSPNKPSEGVYNVSAINDFFKLHERNFNKLLQKDQDILDSEWVQFLSHTHHVFDSLKDLYELAVVNGVFGFPFSSFTLDVSATLMRGIPDHIFNRASFSEFLRMPGQLQQTFHTVLGSALTSDYGPMLKMFAQIASNYAMQGRDEL